VTYFIDCPYLTSLVTRTSHNTISTIDVYV